MQNAMTRSMVVHGVGHYVTDRTSSTIGMRRIDTAYLRSDGPSLAHGLNGDLCHVHLFNDSLGLARRARQFLPDRWSTRRPPYALKLFRAWKVACHAAIRGYLEITEEHSVEWSLGWYVTDEDVKSVIKTDGRFAILCLNPFDLDQRLAYDLAQANDLRRLLAIAEHEVCHLRHLAHDDAFASLHTLVHMQIDDELVVRQMQDAVQMAPRPLGAYIGDLFVPNGTQLRIRRDDTTIYAIVADSEIHLAYEAGIYPTIPAFFQAVVPDGIARWAGVSLRSPDDRDWVSLPKARQRAKANPRPPED